MDPMLMIDDPNDPTFWQSLIRKNSNSLTNLPFDLPDSPMGNLQAINQQAKSPGVDPSTIAQQDKGIQAAPSPVMIPLPPSPPNQGMIAKVMGSMQNGPAKKSKAAAEQELYNLIQAPDVTPAISEQQKSVNDLKARIESYLAQPRQLDLSSLASLTDAWSGSNFSKTYQAPETQAERAKNVAALQNMIAQRQGDLSREQTQLLRDKIGAVSSIVKANKETAPYMLAMQDRLDNSNHERNLKSIKDDSTLNKLYTQTANISRAQDMLTQAQVVPPQQFDEFQQTIRRNLGITGPSGLNEREKTMFNNLGLKASHAEQYLFGKPVNVRESQADFFRHMLDVANVINKANQKQVMGRINQRISGNESMYKRRPDLYSDLMNARGAAIDQFKPENLGLTGTSEGEKPALSFEDFKKLKAEGKI